MQPATDKTLLVLGGTSDIGRAAALAFALRGWSITLAGRNVEALQRDANDISVRTNMSARALFIDILDTTSFIDFVDSLPVLPDVVVCVVGLLGVQSQAEADLIQATLMMRSNYEGPALILGLFAERMLVFRP
jgi:NAD(P)-dependent dehydrogenase (short-subunit alcohol dehydrogenase family)